MMADPDRDGKIFVGKSDKPERLALAFGNRHGLVTGATGTGKTVTLQTMAEGFSRAGVPEFAADIKGVREVLSYISSSDDAKAIGARYGNVAQATVGAVQRQLLVLENQGATKFFGEPALDIKDFMKTDRDGRGYINILAADKLMA